MDTPLMGATQSPYGDEDQDSFAVEAADEMVERMTQVLSWIGQGDQRRFDEYAHVALETVEEIEATLDGGRRSQPGKNAAWGMEAPGALAYSRRPVDCA